MIDYTVDDVLSFVWERHNAWRGKPVLDDVVRTRKFTNVFRVLDRGSQYLLSLMNEYNVDPDEDIVNRLALSYLYRQVNRQDTFDAIIESNDGYIPIFDEVTSAEWIQDVVWPVIDARPGEFLNGAYIILIMTNDKRNLKDKMADIFPGAQRHLLDVAEEDDLATRVKLLQKTPGLGPFLSMQIATDLGYCPGEPDQENDFILPGPGARNGVGYLLNEDGKPASLKQARHMIEMFPVHEMPFLPKSGGRYASLMDVQNVFCEFSKYVRYKEGPVQAREPYQRKEPFNIIIPEQFVIKPLPRS